MNTYLEKRNKLPVPLKEFLISNTIGYEIERVCFMYGLQEDKIHILSAPIALIFIGELNLKDYPALIIKELNQPEKVIYGIAYEINQRIFNRFPDYFTDSFDLLEKWESLKSEPIISAEEAWKKVLELEPWILEDEKEKALEKKSREELLRKEAQNIVSLPIPQALKEIPEIGEQLLTAERIQILSFPDPVRPSLKNWLADYTSFFGYDKHTAIEIGNYLFHGENTRKLSDSDRQKLTYLFTAFNANTPVSVNKNMKQIVFPATVLASLNRIKPQFVNAIPRDGQISNTKIQTPNNNQISNSKPAYSQQSMQQQAMVTRPITNPNFKLPSIPPIVKSPLPEKTILPAPKPSIPVPPARPFSPMPNKIAEKNFSSPKLANLPINQMLQEMPETGEQLLTAQPIQILSFPTPVQPSLKNWLADYVSYNNPENNAPLELGMYLLHSENTQTLSAQERQKLGYVLKAFNTKTPLDLNPATKQIVFPAVAPTTLNPIRPLAKQTFSANRIANPILQAPVPQKNNLPTPAPAPLTNKISFSSPQKLSFEDADQTRGKISFSAPTTPNNLPIRPDSPAAPRPNTIVLQKKPLPSRPISQNVVDLRQE